MLHNAASKLMLAMLVVVLASAIAASTASAGRISVNVSAIEVLFSALKARAGAFEVSCPTTLGGTFGSAVISKLSRIRWGVVYNASLAEASCTGGSATVLTESLPWEIQYSSFSGVLPIIERISTSVVNAAWEVLINSIKCYLHTTASSPAKLRFVVESGGAVTGYEAEPNARIPLTGEALCAFAGEASLSGVGTVRESRGAPIRITLI